jgi:hypothetical protein
LRGISFLLNLLEEVDPLEDVGLIEVGEGEVVRKISEGIAGHLDILGVVVHHQKIDGERDILISHHDILLMQGKEMWYLYNMILTDHHPPHSHLLEWVTPHLKVALLPWGTRIG